ncbi:MAG: glycosyltransferase family 4 protein [Rickettsiales bacterium]|nr:glycosyltransferase family 4 protein [Rickettsiales bacterium]
MRIWYLNHYASTPDQPMTGAYYLMQAMAEEGHDITVFASGFHYHRRKELRLSGRLFSKRENFGPLKFIWIRTIPTTGRALTRFLNMLSYTFVTLGVALFTKPKPEVIIATCPHPFAGALGWALSKCFRAKFVYEIRDIWPESLTEGGVVSTTHPLVRLMYHLQRFLYKRADLVVSVLPKLDSYLEERHIAYQQFLWAPNCVLIDAEKLPTPHDIAYQPSPFIMMYLGGHSRYQRLYTLLDAALILQSQGVSSIRLVLVGDGSEKQNLIEKARSMGLTNIEFWDSVPRSEIMSVAAKADAFLLHFQAVPLLKYGISNNKLCDYMLAARPIVFAAEAINNAVEETRSGVSIQPENPQAMASAIQQLAQLSPAERHEMSVRAQAYAIEHYDVRKQAQKLTAVLAKISK